MLSTPIKTPIIFFPGTLCDERIWFPLWKTLNIEERAYVPLQWADSLESMLALSADRLNNGKQDLHLVGFSMGGYIAALSALAHAERVKSITFIGYNPYGLSQEEVSSRQAIIKNIASGKLNNKNFAKTNEQRLAQYFTNTELQQSTFTQPIIDMGNDLGVATLASHIKACTPREDLSSKLSDLAVAQHFIVGEHDKIANLGSIQKYVSATPQAKMTKLLNTGHITPLTKTKEIASLLQQIDD